MWKVSWFYEKVQNIANFGGYAAILYGTLYQLRILTGRTNVKRKPIDSFDPCEDFFLVAIEAHIVVAAMKMLKLTSVHGTPSIEFAPQGDETWTETAEKRKAIINHISSSLVESYMHPDYKTTSPGTTTSSDSSRTVSPNFDDGVYTYATNLLTLGCFTWNSGMPSRRETAYEF